MNSTDSSDIDAGKSCLVRIPPRIALAVATLAAFLTGCGMVFLPVPRSAPTTSGGPGPAPASEPAATSAPPAEVDEGADARRGTDLAGCADAHCTVTVRPGDRLPIDPGFGVAAITVEALGDEEILLTCEGSIGMLSARGRNVRISQHCVNGRCRGVARITLAVGQPGRINDIRMWVEAVTPSQAVLSLSTE